MVSLDESPQEPPAGGGDPGAELEGTERMSRVLATMGTLPASQQEVLRLRFGEELSYKEISAVTGRSVSHVGVLIHEGMKSLRARLAGPAPARAEGGE
jgi:RNA polymerase sigma-70 factor (ECF subfamily)